MARYGWLPPHMRGRPMTLERIGCSVQPGRYYVSVRPDEERPSLDVDASPTSLAPTYYPSTAVASEAQPIDVGAGVDAVADITVVPTRVTTVSGEVVDGAGRPAVAGVVLLVAGADEPNARFVMAPAIGPGGTFTLSGVAPGDYTLSVRVIFDDAATMRIAASGSFNEPGFTVPLAVSGTPIDGLRVVVPSRIELTGRVIFEGASANPDLTPRISATPSLGSMHGEATATPVDAAGRFTLPLRPGSWRFTAWTPPGWMIKRITFRGATIEPDDPVEVTSEPGARLEILLTSQLTVMTGTASDASGAPVADYHAVVFPPRALTRHLARVRAGASRRPTARAVSGSRACRPASTSSPR